ncbi:MAG: hypothetical protein ACT4QF_03335 [Sporichthyaceae bacterium]
MSLDRDHLPAAPGDPERGSVAGHRASGDAADVGLTFRPTGPAYRDPRLAAEDRYSFHAQSWFDGPGNGVDGLVQAARSGSWDPLVDPLPELDAPAGLPSQTGSCAAAEAEIEPEPEPEPALAVVQVTASRRRAGRVDERWTRAAYTATQPVDLESWFRPADPAAVLTQPVDLHELFNAQDDEPYADHPSGPLPQTGVWPPEGGVPDSPAFLAPEISDAFDATLNGALGFVELGFRAGYWYSITDTASRPVTTTEAMRIHPRLASQITQIVCWYMRQHPMTDRALDLAAELSTAVNDLTAG